MTTNDFAMLDDGEFKGIFRLAEMPDLPGKPYRAFYPVKNEYGERFEGLENGYWVIRHPDHSTLPPPVPYAVTPRQARLALLSVGKLVDVDAAVANGSEADRITWEYAVEIRRDDPLIEMFSTELGFTAEQIDDLFRAASVI